MNKKRSEEIASILRVFGFGKLQDLMTLYRILEKEGISLKTLGDYIEYNIKLVESQTRTMKELVNRRKKLWDKNTRKCPTCMKPLALRPINTPKGKANREGYTCHWYCLDEKCNFEEYTKEDFQKIYKKIMGGR